MSSTMADVEAIRQNSSGILAIHTEVWYDVFGTIDGGGLYGSLDVAC